MQGRSRWTGKKNMTPEKGSRLLIGIWSAVANRIRTKSWLQPLFQSSRLDLMLTASRLCMTTIPAASCTVLCFHFCQNSWSVFCCTKTCRGQVFSMILVMDHSVMSCWMLSSLRICSSSRTSRRKMLPIVFQGQFRNSMRTRSNWSMATSVIKPLSQDLPWLSWFLRWRKVSRSGSGS